MQNKNTYWLILNETGDLERERRDPEVIVGAGERLTLRCIIDEDDGGDRELCRRLVVCAAGDLDDRRRFAGDRERFRIIGEERRGERVRDRVYDRDRRSPGPPPIRRGGDAPRRSRRSVLRRSFSAMIRLKADNVSSMTPVPILAATPWKTEATEPGGTGIIRGRMLWCIEDILWKLPPPDDG